MPLREGRFAVLYKAPPDVDHVYRGHPLDYRYVGDWFYVLGRGSPLADVRAQVARIKADPYNEAGWKYDIWRIE